MEYFTTKSLTMKIKTLLLSVLALCSFVACDDDDDINYLQEPYFAMSHTAPTVSKKGTTIEMLISTTRDWKAEYNASEVTIEPNSGLASFYPQEVKVTVPANAGDPRQIVVNFKAETVGGTLTITQKGEGSLPDDVNYDTAPEKTVAEFIAAADKEHVYKLKGVVSGFNVDNGTFTLTDETGSIAIFSVDNVNDFDEVEDKGTIEIVGLYDPRVAAPAPAVTWAHFVSFESAKAPEPGDEFLSNIKWELGENAYDQTAVVNGIEGVSVLKIGTSSAAGSATALIPAGTKYVTFYGISWSDKPAIMTISAMGQTVWGKELPANPGLKGNDPYTLTVMASSRLVVDLTPLAGGPLPFDVPVTISTGSENTRIAIFGLKAWKDEPTEAVVPEVENPDQEPDQDATEYTSDVTWEVSADNKSYEQEATINGVSGIKVLKLGTGSAAGSATINIPAGTKTVVLYGLSWKDKPASMVAIYGGDPIAGMDFAANDGLSGNAPYTIAVTEADKYTIQVEALLGMPAPMDLPVTITTSSENTRIALFGIKAIK